METIEDSHIPEDVLSRYAFHGIPSDDTRVTNHLIACDECHEVYEHHLNLKAAMTRSTGTETTASRSRVTGWRKTLWATAAAVLLGAFMIPGVQRQPSESQVLDVVSVRGGQAVQARSNVPLVLRLDTTGLDVPPNAPVDVVNAEGRSVWKGAAQQLDSKWQAETSGLRKGRYWVRLADPVHPGELLREFQLEVE